MKIARQAAGAKFMKGRPIVREEHERIVMAISKVLPASKVPAWETF